MITKKQILIYIKYDGDSDGFARCATKSERNTLTDDIWLLLDGIVFDLHLINSNLASKENADRISSKLGKTLNDDSLVKILSDYSNKR